MGGGPSRTRKLTVENDDPNSVIKVSDDLAHRIRNQATSSARPSRQQTKDERQDPLPPDPQVSLGQVPVAPFLYDPRISNTQMRQANLAELKKNDQYWKNRLKNLQNNQENIDKIIQNECQRAIEELSEERREKAKLPSCGDCKHQVMQCYRTNPNETIKCAPLVQAFQECVDNQRHCLTVNRG